MDKISITQRFINNYLKETYDVYLIEISQKEFDEYIKEHESKKEYAYKIIKCFLDIPIHPLQKIYLLNDVYYSYESGGSDWDYRFCFKYKGNYYMFCDCGGS